MIKENGNRFEGQDQAELHRRALLELAKEVEFFRKTDPSSQEGRSAAKSLTERIILQTGSHRLSKEDWRVYRETVEAAAQETASGYGAEIGAYDNYLRELIAQGKNREEAEMELANDVRGPKKYLDLTRDECLYRLQLLLSENLLDFKKRNFWMQRSFNILARQEIEELLGRDQLDLFDQTEALGLLKKYAQMGILDKKTDGDIFKKFGD